MNLLSLGLKSLVNRRSTAILTLVTIAISVALLLGVEKVRDSARSSFASTISGASYVSFLPSNLMFWRVRYRIRQ